MLSSAFVSAVLLQATPWMFDFDVSQAQDPGAVSSALSDLADGLPQPPDEQLSEVVLDDVTLYFFTEMLEVYEQADASGPAIAGPLEREATLCAAHQAFTIPTLIADSGGACTQSAGEITAILNGGIDACMYTEFPELYVYDHQPGGELQPDTLESFEGLIAYAGEALTHIDDYPVNLMVPGFWATARGVIAKLRFFTLRDALDGAVSDYGRAQSLLDNGCFDPTVAATLSVDLDALTAEALATRAWLVGLYQDGLVQAAADRAALLAQGRTRAELPYPFSDSEREWLAFYVAGVYWRIRGAGLINNPPEDEPGETAARREWYVKIPFEHIADMSGSADDVASVAFWIAFDENWGYAEWFDMGRMPGGQDAYFDLVHMTNRGKRAVARAEPLLAGRDFDTAPLMAGALQMGPCYYYPWEELRFFTVGPDLQDPYMQFLELPTAIGEFCTGATLALGLVRTLLWGKPCTPSCAGRQCGDNGCGGSCGTCAVGTVCQGGACVGCTPSCGGRECGDDSCGGICGTCGVGEYCDDGVCEVGGCDCTGRQCGPNGCGGTCGGCAVGSVCRDGACVACTPDCSSRVCGNDGCGGSCGTCAGECREGRCEGGTTDPKVFEEEGGVCGAATSPALPLLALLLLRRRSRRK